MLQCDYGKAVAAKLKAKFTPMEKDLKKDGEAIKKLEAELKNQDLALKLEAKQDKQREFRRLARDYQDSVAAYRQKRQMEQQKLGQPIVEKSSKSCLNMARLMDTRLFLRWLQVVCLSLAMVLISPSRLLPS